MPRVTLRQVKNKLFESINRGFRRGIGQLFDTLKEEIELRDRSLARALEIRTLKEDVQGKEYEISCKHPDSEQILGWEYGGTILKRAFRKPIILTKEQALDLYRYLKARGIHMSPEEERKLLEGEIDPETGERIYKTFRGAPWEYREFEIEKRPFVREIVEDAKRDIKRKIHEEKRYIVGEE